MRAIVAAVVTVGMMACAAGGAEVPAGATPKKIVFFGGVKTHGPGEHDHLRGAQFLKKCIDAADGIRPCKTQIYLDTWPKDPGELEDAATIVILWEGWELHLVNSRNMEKVRCLDRLMHRGVGLVCFHAATAVDDDVQEYFLDWIGGNKSRSYSLHPMAHDLDVGLAAPGHPVCRGVRPMKFAAEEFYCKILFRPGDRRITPILTAMLPPERPVKQVVGWACERADGGRAFATTGPHYHASFANDDFRKLALNAILWTAKIEVPEGGCRAGERPQESDSGRSGPNPAR